jgi:hypothetical protein
MRRPDAGGKAGVASATIDALSPRGDDEAAEFPR